MQSKEQLVKGFFNAIAGKYDVTNLIVSLGRCNYWQQFLIQKTGKVAGGILLDVCCGTGKVTVNLAKKAGPGGIVVGVDFSENMLAIAKKKLDKLKSAPSSSIAQIRFIQGNAMALPFSDNTFDCATIAYGLRNVTDLKQALWEIKRVVKPGGKVASLEMVRPCGTMINKIFDLYAGQCIPLIGKLITGNKEAYRYLYESILSYINPEEVTAIFRELGFKNVQCYKLTLGMATVHVGIK